jgi:hypothetical protein
MCLLRVGLEFWMVFITDGPWELLGSATLGWMHQVILYATLKGPRKPHLKK